MNKLPDFEFKSSYLGCLVLFVLCAAVDVSVVVFFLGILGLTSIQPYQAFVTFAVSVLLLYLCIGNLFER